MTRRAIDLTGQLFGALTVTGRGGKIGTNAAWECLCACGRVTIARSDNLRRGMTRTCGNCKSAAPGQRAITTDTADFLIEIYQGERKRSPTVGTCTYAFGIIRNRETGKMVAMPDKPRDCANPVASLLKEAFRAGVIRDKENRPTIHRWLTEEQVVIASTHALESNLDVILAWELASGQTHPDSWWMKKARERAAESAGVAEDAEGQAARIADEAIEKAQRTAAEQASTNEAEP
jgi:hypothetical protein